jgi:hypothetical protein
MAEEYFLYVAEVLDRYSPEAQWIRLYSPAKNKDEAKILLEEKLLGLPDNDNLVIISVNEVKTPGFKLEKIV